MAFQTRSKTAGETETPENRNVEVIVLWGGPGTGKTRTVRDEGAYFVDHHFYNWWDRYNGEKTICFDDFYGQINHAKLLKLLDGQCKLKKGNGLETFAQWTKVYIISHTEPKKWYSTDKTNALMSKITKIIEF